MKYILIAATLLTLTACCTCMDKPATSVTQSTHHNLSCSTAKVSGMTCEACSATVAANLNKLSGVKNTQIDVATGTVKIYTDKKSSVTKAQVKSIVEKSGYTFTSLTPTCN